MKRLYCLIVLSLLCGRLAAQRLHSFHFHDASLAAVLDTLAAVQDEYSITFIHNDLEHLHVSARIKNLTIKEAVEKVCKGQPVKVKTRRQQVFVQYKPRKNFPNKTIQITGLVLDSFTLKPVGQIDVTILDATHTVISRTRTAAGPIPVSATGIWHGHEYRRCNLEHSADKKLAERAFANPAHSLRHP